MKAKNEECKHPGQPCKHGIYCGCYCDACLDGYVEAITKEENDGKD